LNLQLASEPSYWELVASTQFADGAAAAIVSADNRGPTLIATDRVLLPEVDEGGSILPSETGLRLVAASGLPRLVRTRVHALVDRLVGDHALNADALTFILAHPRGREVIDAVADGLRVPKIRLAAAYAAWEKSGNMVSASIYRALIELCRDMRPADGDVGLLIAFGTGVACEMTLTRWRPDLDAFDA
jgi:predicted naringenin-chalcone synthase